MAPRDEHAGASGEEPRDARRQGALGHRRRGLFAGVLLRVLKFRVEVEDDADAAQGVERRDVVGVARARDGRGGDSCQLSARAERQQLLREPPGKARPVELRESIGDAGAGADRRGDLRE